MQAATVSVRHAPLLALLLVAGCSRPDAGPSSKRDDPAARGARAPAVEARSGSRPSGRLVVLGFDGVDPDWLDRWRREGKLPNLQRLVASMQGKGYRRLGSTNPPQSPVAWTTFATGTRPGQHGIYDFIRRALVESPQGPPVRPAIGTTEVAFHADGPPSARNLRTGVPFWKLLADQGVRVRVINVPYGFPPDPMREGKMLSGLGVPDLRGTNSTFTLVGTDVTEQDARHPPGGGVLVPLRLRGGRGFFALQGPPLGPGEGRAEVRVAMQAWPADAEMDLEGFRRLKERSKKEGFPVGGVRLTVGERSLDLYPRVWSDWVTLRFDVAGRTVRGMVRFRLLECSPRAVRLFVTPISLHPEERWLPFTYPAGFAKELREAVGRPYKTVGWDHDTSALNAGALDEAAFLEDVDAVEKDRRRMLLDALERDDWDLLIWVSTSTDRVAHMFYRLIDPRHPVYDEALAKHYGGAIEREYRRMDETVGAVLERLGPRDTLLVLSDHGFHNFRRGLHLNQWLRRQGMLALKDDAEASERDFLLDVDWSRTKAYALGTGQLYLNLRGRERDGIVSEAEAPALLTKIREGLLALRDTERGGAPVIREVYLGREVFRGARSAEAPDLQVAFAEGYRTSWETILGGVPRGLFADNDRKWSGDHAASDVRDTEGILIATRPLRDGVAIVDLAPSVFAHFGRPVPAVFEGRPVWGAERVE